MPVKRGRGKAIHKNNWVRLLPPPCEEILVSHTSARTDTCPAAPSTSGMPLPSLHPAGQGLTPHRITWGGWTATLMALPVPQGGCRFLWHPQLFWMHPICLKPNRSQESLSENTMQQKAPLLWVRFACKSCCTQQFPTGRTKGLKKKMRTTGSFQIPIARCKRNGKRMRLISGHSDSDSGHAYSSMLLFSTLVILSSWKRWYCAHDFFSTNTEEVFFVLFVCLFCLWVFLEADFCAFFRCDWSR